MWMILNRAIAGVRRVIQARLHPRPSPPLR
jgi:hypothetical protein